MLAQYKDNKGIGLGGLFESSKINVDEYKEFINEFKNIESFDDFIDFDTNKINWDSLSKSIGITDANLRSYLETLDNGNGTINNQAASIEGLSKHLQKAGNGFSTAALKTTLLNSALNAGIFLAASFAIQAIATGIDNYIHRVENARERTAELFEEFSQRNDTLSAHKKVVADSAGRYTRG